MLAAGWLGQRVFFPHPRCLLFCLPCDNTRKQVSLYLLVLFARGHYFGSTIPPYSLTGMFPIATFRTRRPCAIPTTVLRSRGKGSLRGGTRPREECDLPVLFVVFRMSHSERCAMLPLLPSTCYRQLATVVVVHYRCSCRYGLSCSVPLL